MFTFISFANLILPFLALATGMPTGTTEISEDAIGENCWNANGRYYTGIKPVTSFSSPTFCQYFWHCRAKPDGTVEAEKFNCTEADPTKPYYDATQCKCAATPDHCPANDEVQNQYKCIRLFSEDENREESCRKFGPDGAHTLNLFPNLHDLGQYWSCRLNKVDGSAFAERMPCPQGLIFDLKECVCNYNSTDVHQIQRFNVHPMNRFNCPPPSNSNRQQNISLNLRHSRQMLNLIK